MQIGAVSHLPKNFQELDQSGSPVCYVCHRILLKGGCHQCEVLIVYLEKARAVENIGCKAYVRWQVWTLGPLNRQVKVYHATFKAKFKGSWQAVEIGTGKHMIAKWFARTTKYFQLFSGSSIFNNIPGALLSGSMTTRAQVCPETLFLFPKIKIKENLSIKCRKNQ